MFAVKVDDVNFWEEVDKCGRQVHRSFGDVRWAADGNAPAFSERLDWIGAETGGVVATEERCIQVVPGSGKTPTVLTWETTLAAPLGKDAITITGAHYHGLGMRFLESMDKDGRFLNAADEAGEVVRGEERLVQGASWCAYSAEADGKPVTVAMFDHPRNPRPATWFTMPVHFAYLSATLNVWREPLEIKAGAPATLRYGVALWDGTVSKRLIESAYEQWRAGAR